MTTTSTLNPRAPMVQIRGLRKAYGEHVVLNGIDFDVQPQQVVVVIGPSGSGKSTFLRCCNGLEQPQGGQVDICGRTLVKDGVMLADKELIRRHDHDGGHARNGFCPRGG